MRGTSVVIEVFSEIGLVVEGLFVVNIGVDVPTGHLIGSEPMSIIGVVIVTPMMGVSVKGT